MLTLGILVVAGVVAGVIGTAGGITSLVAYPALLAVGIPPLAANVTNSVALIGSGASSAFRARHEVRADPAVVRRWMPTTVVASLAGAVLLVVTPAHLFDRIVPFLVLAGDCSSCCSRSSTVVVHGRPPTPVLGPPVLRRPGSPGSASTTATSARGPVCS